MKQKAIIALRNGFMVLLMTLFSFQAIWAQGKIFQLGEGNKYAAAVLTEKFKYYAGSQRENMWCWAACIQMVIHYQGLYMEQCDIVKKALDREECINIPADCYTIEDGANGWRIDGKQVNARVDFSPSTDELVDQLAYKNPVIIGLDMPQQNTGHAYVLTAVYFRRNGDDEKVPYKVVLRDPWPGNPSKQEFGWNDFINRINCITYVSVH